MRREDELNQTIRAVADAMERLRHSFADGELRSPIGQTDEALRQSSAAFNLVRRKLDESRSTLAEPADPESPASLK
jgi:hypothetical protein